MFTHILPREHPRASIQPPLCSPDGSRSLSDSRSSRWRVLNLHMAVGYHLSPTRPAAQRATTNSDTNILMTEIDRLYNHGLASYPHAAQNRSGN